MEFVDLPITQFLLGDSILYKTKLAQYAFDNISNPQIYNRIKKYYDRGYLTVRTIYYNYSMHSVPTNSSLYVSSEQRIVSIFDYIDVHIIEYNIDCKLSDIELLNNIYKNNIHHLLPCNKIIVTNVRTNIKDFSSNIYLEEIIDFFQTNEKQQDDILELYKQNT